MMPLFRSAKSYWARAQTCRRSTVSVDETARVNWQGVCRQPPSFLDVGRRSIVQARITSDREGSRLIIGHDSFVGDSIIVVAQEVRIGSGVLISWGCTIVDHDSHSLDWKSRQRDVSDTYVGRKTWDGVPIKAVSIGDKAWIGFNVIILKGVHIGEGAVVAAGSVVTRDIESFTLAAGSPARKIRQLERG